MDVSGMYLLIAFEMLYNVNQMYNGSRFSFILTYVGANIPLFLQQVMPPGVRRYIFAVLVAGASWQRKYTDAGRLSYRSTAVGSCEPPDSCQRKLDTSF